MTEKLWNRNFTLCIVATVLGCVGSVASEFALSLLVYDETGSTLASALVIAIRIIPGFLLPLMASPILDRFPRLPFVVAGDALNGVLYGAMGLYLLFCPFSYVGYLGVSLILSVLGTLDSMAFNALYPNLIARGCEQKGYTVSSMVYSTVTVVIMPVAALLYDHVGVSALLFIQFGLSVTAAVVESRIKFQEPKRSAGKWFSLRVWYSDLNDAFQYLKKEKGLLAIFSYMAVTNGAANGYSPIQLAYFRTMPGLSAALYSFFSVAEFAGRTLGGLVSYRAEIPKKKQFGLVFVIYQLYDLMDTLLLWLPYPLMLANRGICGFLGVNSAALRSGAVQRYIPDELRAKLNGFQDALISGAGFAFTLLLGFMGEFLDLRWCITLCGLITLLSCWLTVWRYREKIANIYNRMDA